MHHARVVRLGQALGELRADIEHLLRRQWLAQQERATQRLAIHVFHDDVGTSFAVPDFMDRDDVRVIQARGGPRLLRKTRQALRIRGKPLRQELDGDVAMQIVIAGAEHLPHTPGADVCEELVSAEAGAKDGVQGDGRLNYQWLPGTVNQ